MSTIFKKGTLLIVQVIGVLIGFVSLIVTIITLFSNKTNKVHTNLNVEAKELIHLIDEKDRLSEQQIDFVLFP